MSDAGAAQCACPLCGQADSEEFYCGAERRYLQCRRCALVHVPRRYHLSRSAERERYESHRNSPRDQRYREFLNRLAGPLRRYLQPGSRGLDYGCGPGPTLSVMLEEQGFPMAVYDPFFAPQPEVLRQCYDFVTCSEAIEHFAAPDRDWQRLLALLRGGGVLAIMTQLLDADIDFANWYYRRDPTHIRFFSRDTFDWLAARDRLTVDYYGDSVAIFRC